MSSLKLCIFPVIASLLVTQNTGAATIVTPAGASTDLNNDADLVRIINQSGLSAGYTSGVTDFDAYIATAPTHNITNTHRWFGTENSGIIDFDLGGAHTIESFALWNVGGNNGANVTVFNLLADDNPSFSSPTTLLSSQSANPNTGPTTTTLAEVFSFTPEVASFVRFQITSNNGSIFTGVKEVAFEATAIPEPTRMLLSLAAIAAITLRRRR